MNRTNSEEVTKWCCAGNGKGGHLPACRYHESNYAPSNPPPARAEPSRGAPEAAQPRCETCKGEFDPEVAVRDYGSPDATRFCCDRCAGICSACKLPLVRESGHVVLIEALRRCVAVMNEVELHEGKKFFTYTKREAEAAIQQAERT